MKEAAVRECSMTTLQLVTLAISVISGIGIPVVLIVFGLHRSAMGEVRKGQRELERKLNDLRERLARVETKGETLGETVGQFRRDAQELLLQLRE